MAEVWGSLQENQTQNLLDDKIINLDLVKDLFKKILEKCYVKVWEKNSINLEVTETPKRIFRTSIIDTEPRLVAFIDILGFKEIIEEYDSNEFSNILRDLHDALEMAIKISIENMTN